MPRYLVTGGAGFIGSHLVERLLGAGHQVRVLDDLSTGKAGQVPDDAELMIGSITDPAYVTQATQEIDGCFHLAAIASVQQCQQDWVASHNVNLTGTLRLFEAAASQGFPIVYTSSAAVYGEAETLPITEASPVHPLGPYGADKLGCDLHAEAFRRIHALPCVGLRPFNVYGPRQDPSSPYSGVISIFMQRIREKQPITIYGDGEQTRDFIAVQDVVSAFTSAIQGLETDAASMPPLVNLCTGEAVSINTLAAIIGAITGQAPDIAHAPERAGDIRHSLGDPAPIHTLIGKTTLMPLKDGLAAMA